MSMLRKSTLWLAVSLFAVTALLFGLGWGLLQVFGNADSIKGALARSGIYESVIDNELQRAQQEQGVRADTNLPLDKPEVQDIIKAAAPPELLQTKTENAIDAVYAWIHGEKADLEFSLEIGDIRANLADGIEQHVAARSASLPLCPPGAHGNIATDPFNATCRPAVVDPAQIAAQAKKEFLNSEVLQDTTINADSIKTDNGETLTQKVENAPNAYQRASWTVYGSGILALLLAAAVVLLSTTWRSGAKKVAIIVIVLGVLSLAANPLAAAGMSQVAGLTKEPLQESGIKVAEALVNDLRTWWLWYGIVLVVAGVATLVALRILKPKPDEFGDTSTPPEPSDTSSAQSSPESSRADSASTKSPKPPKPIKKIVQ